MGPKKYRNTNFLFVAVVGICLIIFSVFVAGLHTTARSDTTSGSQQSNGQYFRTAAQTASALGCQGFDTIFGTNFNQQLQTSYSVLSQMSTRLPGTNTSLLNFEYNDAASQAYNLYTSTLNVQNCTPSVPAPSPLSPAAPPSNTIDPSTLTSSGIPVTCAYPLAIQLLANYYQQYIVNMQNSQSNLVNFVSNLQPAPTFVGQRLTSGSASVQAQLYANAQNLVQQYSTDISRIGC